MASEPLTPARRVAPLALALILFGLPYLLAPATAIDDALITARYSDNLAHGDGLVYNVHERVLGTTTPLWAAASSWIYRLPVSSSGQATVLCLASGLCLLAAILTVARALHPAPGRARDWTFLALCLSPTLVVASHIGMETGPLLLVVALLWRSLAVQPNSPLAWLWRSGLAVCLLLLRLDSVFALASLAIGYVLVYRPGRTDWKWMGTASALVVSATLAWLVFCQVFYGHFLPHSMLAKMGSAGPMSSAEGLGSALVDRFRALLELNFPWPRAVVRFAEPLWALLVGASIGLTAWRYPTLPPRHRMLSVAAACYVTSYTAFFVVGRASVFPWYAHLPVFLWLSATVPALSERSAPWLARVVLAGLLLGFLSMQALLIRGTVTGRAALAAEEDLGLYLHQLGCESVMLEPIGYIGFHSKCVKVYDLAGLVSPDVLSFRRQGHPGWFADASAHFRPQYVVLRDGEVERNVGWNVGVLFGSPRQRDEWLTQYERVRPTAGWTSSYALYRRR